jgi:hypothetical protein
MDAAIVFLVDNHLGGRWPPFNKYLQVYSRKSPMMPAISNCEAQSTFLTPLFDFLFAFTRGHQPTLVSGISRLSFLVWDKFAFASAFHVVVFLHGDTV